MPCNAVVTAKVNSVTKTSHVSSRRLWAPAGKSLDRYVPYPKCPGLWWLLKLQSSRNLIKMECRPCDTGMKDWETYAVWLVSFLMHEHTHQTSTELPHYSLFHLDWHVVCCDLSSQTKGRSFPHWSPKHLDDVWRLAFPTTPCLRWGSWWHTTTCRGLFVCHFSWK